MRVIILGYPHTATTFIYKYVLTRLKDHIGVFEPFNAEVVRLSTRGSHLMHYSEGSVRHDYHHLPRSLFNTIIENVKWFDDWVANDVPTTPFCGYHFRRIMDSIMAMKNVVMKDVVVWARMDEIINSYPQALFILPIRSKHRVLNSFVKLRDVYRKGGELDKLHPRWMMGIALFYRHFNGYTSYRGKTLVEMFEDTYTRYVMMCKKASQKRNVVVLDFGERLEPCDIDLALTLSNKL